MLCGGDRGYFINSPVSSGLGSRMYLKKVRGIKWEKVIYLKMAYCRATLILARNENTTVSRTLKVKQI